ncbi:WG containing repeat-containing protein [Micromonospora pattaloongensis]|uniref:WG containing repeat-containing protein n=1 Tax=Micromonospora pattaloongensis TaxID=405436 RepID=A0A1H3PWX2_9ACTN|nr:WG repeat-containing protein [Micromonospora pattaloongensis]SDZ05566.1 WG containing repeat-containing protein [Micromonospora pattaloongensis]
MGSDAARAAAAGSDAPAPTDEPAHAPSGAPEPAPAGPTVGGTPEASSAPGTPPADPAPVPQVGSAGRAGGDGDADAPSEQTDPPGSAPGDDGSAPDDDRARAGTPVAEASPDTVLPAPEGAAAGAATALAAPTMLAPIVRPGEPNPAAEPPAEPRGTEAPAGDPEQVLSSYRWRFHHETLRELVEDPDELRAIRDRLTEKLEPATDNRTRARLLSLRAVVSRILGDLGKALSDGKLALAHAEATGELRRIAIAQARLAHVLQWRGDFAEADRLFEEANSSELPDRLRATMHEHAGRSCYDQGRYIEACNHFERALELRKVEDPDLIARTELALDAVLTKVAQKGWGPYPRSRDEVLQAHRPPAPRFSERVQRWGYADADGELAIAPSYADVQPFRDGVAWVRRPETETWELIDETGELLVGASAGYLGVGSFSDGLAWVSRNGAGSWIAIDKTNTVVISEGFDDVRPFRRGVAAVRKGGWGAVDKSGRLVVPTRYSGFTTALTDGRYVDGFTDEGLAIVDVSGRKGVVDRGGRVIVPPAHPALVIHPVAFLVGSGAGQWGALDRRGEPLIDMVHPSRADVMDEIDRLLADTKPVL